MNIADLYVNLGVKGSEKTVGALATTKKGLGEIASTSLEAKAAIVGAMYALERLFAASGAAGTGLTNLNALTNVNRQTLQQYDYAARQVGISNGVMEGTFKSLQGAMAKTLMGQGAPSGLAQVARLTGDIGRGDIAKFVEHPELLIQRLQEYAKKEKNVGVRNEVLKSFVPEDMIPGLVRGAFSPNILKKAPTYGEGELNALDRANIAWSNLGLKIEMAVGHFNALHGGQLVSDFTKLTTAAIKFAEAMLKVTEHFKIFDKIGSLVGGLTGTLDDLSGQSKRSFWGDQLDKSGKPKTGLPLLEGGAANAGDAINKFFQSIYQDLKSGDPNRSIVPTVPGNPGATSKGTKVDIQQTLQFNHDGTDPSKNADSHKKAAKQAYWQNPAIGQAT